MTINQLLESLAPGVKSKSPVNFAVALCREVAIDFNFYFYMLCFKNCNELLMTNDHVHKPNDIIKTIESWYERIIKNNVVPYYVFDEVKHCIKSKTHANLSDNRNKAKIAFDSFYES